MQVQFDLGHQARSWVLIVAIVAGRRWFAAHWETKGAITKNP
jgi:hypothetical protein